MLLRSVFVVVAAGLLISPISLALDLSDALPASLLTERPSHTDSSSGATEFDHVALEYASRIEQSDNGTVATFDTLLGIIAFNSDEVTVQWVQAPDPVPAFVRIGRQHSSESPELIVAWLTESTAMKLEQGYEEVAREEFQTAYGRASFALLRKGDQYFSTYVQSERTQNGSDAVYLAHSYYIEFGIWSRAGAFRRQQALLKLGD